MAGKTEALPGGRSNSARALPLCPSFPPRCLLRPLPSPPCGPCPASLGLAAHLLGSGHRERVSHFILWRPWPLATTALSKHHVTLQRRATSLPPGLASCPFLALTGLMRALLSASWKVLQGAGCPPHPVPPKPDDLQPFHWPADWPTGRHKPVCRLRAHSYSTARGPLPSADRDSEPEPKQLRQRCHRTAGIYKAKAPDTAPA